MLDVDALLADLTEPQRDAATHVDGPLLIVAGAGSGKTRVITRRVAYLIAQGIPPSAILAITFTNKAAGEMKERVGHVLGKPVRDFGRLDQPWPMICTFHSLCLRILRHYSERVGLGASFSIYDSSDQTKLIKDALKTLEVSSDNFSPGSVHAAISNAKNALVTAEQFAGNARDFFTRTVARVYTKYEAMLKQNNALDFDDLLLRTVLAFREHKGVLAELQDRFQYILIDEYQDTNHVQYMLAHLLAMKHQNIGVVGDPDQSIYAWRGADLKNILEFERDYPRAKVVRLEQNYRSTKTILKLASDLISHNFQRKEKALWTDNPTGPKAELTLCQDEHDEAQVVMRRLKELHDKDQVPWSEMAIFFRMQSLSRVMEEALFKAQLPYQIARGTEFYNRKEIKDVLAYLRVIANPADEVSLTRIVNVPPRGFGDTSLKVIQTHGIGRGLALFDALGEASRIPGVSTRAANSAVKFVEMVKGWRKSAGVQAAAAAPVPETATDFQVDGEIGMTRVGDTGKANSFASSMTLFGDEEWDAAPLDEELPESVTDPAEDVPFAGFGEEETVSETASQTMVPVEAESTRPGRVRMLMEEVVRTSGMEAHLKKTGDADLSELKNVEELISAAAEYDTEHPEGSLVDYLAQVSLVSDVDRLDGGEGAITLMTLHAAKGLEFPVVAIIGIEDGCLPHSRARDNVEQLEEERRLFFVGITRAERRLILTRAHVRTVRGLRGPTIPSPFLRELPEEYLAIQDRGGAGGYGGSGYGSSSFGQEGGFPSERQLAGFRMGQMVRHPTFGVGRIAELSGAGARTRAVIDFNSAGRKILILEVAKLTAM